jgi:hypothetical protein
VERHRVLGDVRRQEADGGAGADAPRRQATGQAADEPEASHLLLLEAVAGRPLLERSYAASLEAGYLWHEFGDVHLVLP